LIGDRAYDSDPLDDSLAYLGVEMIAPHRRNRIHPKTQDGRSARAGTEGGGKLSDSSPGWGTSAGWWYAMSAMLSTTWPSFNSAASSSCSDTAHEPRIIT
jgi:hypothetical protein